MSIRTFLTLVIAVMGVALLAVAGLRMSSDAGRSVRAQDVVTMAEIGQSLLPALFSSRVERRTAVVASMAAEPADAASWQRLAVHRPITDAMCAQSIAALRASSLGTAADLADRLAAAHDRAAALRPSIDAALRLPLQARDAELLARYSEVSMDYVTAISAATKAVEQATTLFDPEIDRLIWLNRAATAARYYSSLITLRMESAVAFNLPWRPQDIVEAAEDSGRADLAWRLVFGVADEPGVPQSLVQAIEAAKLARDSPDAKRQATVIARLRAGGASGVSVSELQQLNTRLLDPLDSVMREAMTEMVSQAKRYQHDAKVSLAVTVTLLFVILCLTGFGIAVVHQRVSRPIRRITRQMSRLKESDGSLGIDASTIEDDFGIEDAGRNDEIGEMTRALIVFRRQVEEHGRRLQEHEMRRFLETLIDAMPVSITFKDTDLRYRYANRSRRHAIGAVIEPGIEPQIAGGDAQLVGKRLSEVVPGESSELVEAADRELLTTGEAQQFEQARTGPDGKPAIIWSLKTPFRDADGKVTGIITCGVNITRLKEIEAELVAQREKAEAGSRTKIAFLGSMSHELRTPLNAVIGFADMLAKGYLGPLGDRQREYVGDIRRSGEHLLKMVNDLLDLSNLEVGRQVLDIGACNFDSVAVAALSMVQPQAEQSKIALDFQPTDVTVRADERALTQILVNLLANAIKFSPHGSRIALRAARQQGGIIRIQVEDAGYGMTELQRTSALAATLAAEPSQADPYKARPKGGAGLGLAICRRLIEQHHGTLEIESQSGQGSTVNVVLPAA